MLGRLGSAPFSNRLSSSVRSPHMAAEAKRSSVLSSLMDAGISRPDHDQNTVASKAIIHTPIDCTKYVEY